MDRQSFFVAAQKELVKVCEWKEFVAAATHIRKEQNQYSLPSNLYSNVDENKLHQDTISQELMPDDSNPALLPIEVYGDGNCLFRAISLVIFGSESYHVELQIRTTVELAYNIEKYSSMDTLNSMVETSFEDMVKYIMQVSVSDEAFDSDLDKSLKAEVMLTARSGQYASLIHLFAISNFTGKPINSMYPRAQNPGVNRDVHNQILFPECKMYYTDDLHEVIHVLWTHTSVTSMKTWKPNHFVPCFPKNTVRYIIIIF